MTWPGPLRRLATGKRPLFALLGTGLAGTLLTTVTTPWLAVVGAAAVLLATASVAYLFGQSAWTGHDRRRGADRQRDEGRRLPPPMRVVDRPPPLATFRGRRHDLDELLDRYRHLRQPEAANGAIILAIHGMPGVGKSTLALELARELTAEFPGGQLYANLGNAGSIRAEADILNGFLMSLGLPERQIPESTLDRSARFRSATTSLRLLVILDAARDHEQVVRLLPSGASCLVVVTSRRDLGPALGIRSMLLRVPDMDDALDMLRAVAGVESEFADVQKFAIEIVERVGRLPLAIRAVGDTLRTRGTRVEGAEFEPFKSVARLFRHIAPGDGRGIDERIGSEYGRLTSAEQHVFALCSLLAPPNSVVAPSFVPWALLPLIQPEPPGDHVEIEKVVSRLAERQLLELAGPDEVTGLDRYRLHPICRVFAEHRRREAGAPDRAQQDALDHAYLEALDLILADVEPGYRARNPRAPGPSWFPESLPQQITQLPGRWIRAEYYNLMRAVRAAYASQRWELCWRVGAYLGICVPDGVPAKDVLEVVAMAHRAAEVDGSGLGVAAMLVARGSFVGQLGRYPECYDALAAATQAASALRPSHPAGWLPTRPGASANLDRAGFALECTAARRLAEAYLRLGARRDASYELDRASALAGVAQNSSQADLTGLMRVQLQDDFADVDLPKVDETDDEGVFWHAYGLAELDRRERRWRRAAQRLRDLRERFDEDPLRVCVLLCRLAELRLEELQYGEPHNRQKAKARAVHRAAEALWSYQRLHHVAGTVRARCLFTRALLAMDRVHEAQEQWTFAQGEALEPYLRHPWSPLRADMLRAEGELLCRLGLVDRGNEALMSAARIYHAHNDRMAEHSALALLGLEELPASAFDSGAPGREPHVIVDFPEGEPRLAVPFTVAYRLDVPALIANHYPAGGRYVDVIVTADGADVTPIGQTAWLDSWAPFGPLSFDVTPQVEGSFHLRIHVYAARSSALLQECVVDLPDVTSILTMA